MQPADLTADSVDTRKPSGKELMQTVTLQVSTDCLRCLCRFVEDRIGWVITNLWNLLIKDLEETLNHVTKAVLKEEGVSKDVLKLRAQGLAEIAKIFQVRPALLSWGLWGNVCMQDSVQHEQRFLMRVLLAAEALFVCLSACLPANLSVCLPACLSVCLSVWICLLGLPS